MKKLLFLLLFLNPLYGLKDTSTCQTNEVLLTIDRCFKVDSEDGAKFYLVSKEGAFRIQSINPYATVKLAAFLRTKQNQKIKLKVHFHTFSLADGDNYFFGMTIFNAYE